MLHHSRRGGEYLTYWVRRSNVPIAVCLHLTDFVYDNDDSRAMGGERVRFPVGSQNIATCSPGPGGRSWSQDRMEVWSRPLADGTVAVAFGELREASAPGSGQA